MQVNRITGGSDEFISLIRGLQARVSTLETKGTGSIFISDQIVTQDPNTGVETIFGALPDGRYGLQEWVNDTEPPNTPSTPTVVGDRAVFEITWDGMDAFGGMQPPDYDRTVVQMATSDPNTNPTWVEVNYFTAAGRVIVGGEPYGLPRYFRLISYDKNGNSSIASAHASATLISFMESPEMSDYITDVENAVTDANTAASNAQTAAGTAATDAANARTAAENAEKIAQDAAANSPNLVQNGSFENDFAGWTKEGVSGAITTSTAYDGSKSWTTGTTGAGIYQGAIPVKPGQIFELTAFYKTPANYSGSGGLRIQTSTDGTNFTNTVSPNLTASVDWTQARAEYTVAEGVTHIRARVAFAAGATVTAWVDKVVLIDITSIKALQKTASDALSAANAAEQKANEAAEVAEDAAFDAGNALTAANGKNTVWNQDEKPAGTLHKVNDVWFDTNNENLIHTWNGSDWISKRDGAIDRAFTDIGTVSGVASGAASAASSAESKANEALGTANTAAGNASTALTNANNAVTAANGKNKITTSTDVAPSSYVGAVGDEWRQRSTTTPFEIIKISTWGGSSWTDQTLGNPVIANLNADKLNAGTVSAARIGANTITADKMLVGSVANLVPDPIFSTATIWTANRQTTGGMDGGGSLLIPTGSTLRGFYFGDTAATVSHRIPVVAGGKYRVAVYVQTSTAAAVNTISVYGKVWKSSVTTTTTTTIPGVLRNEVATPAGTGWTRISGIFEIPAGYDRLTLGFYAEAGFTGTARFSNPMVQQAATGELIVDGAITTLKLATNSITAESGIIASLDASKITTGDLDAARLKAGSIQADRLVVGQGDNLISDPRFTPNSALTNARLAGSTAGAVWTTPDFIGWNKTTASATVHTLKLGGQVDNVSRPVIPVIAGRRYKVEWKVYADVITSTSNRAILRWLSRTNVETTSNGAYLPLTAVGTTSYSQEFIAPDDAAFVSLDLDFNRHPGGGWIDFTRPVLQLMTDGTIITKDAITSDHIQAGSIKGDRLDVATAQARLFTGDVFQAIGGTFTGGTFASGVHNGATFQTTSTAARGVKLTPLGLTAYDSTTGNPTVQINADGSASFTGTVNITSGSVPESVVPGLTQTLDDHQAAADTVWGWADPVNRTLINGGNIATNSITANQIALGAGTNFVSGGDGGDNRGWDDFQYFSNVPAGYPPNSKGVYALTGPKLGYSPAFNVAGLNKYAFSYFYNCPQTNILHETFLAFYDINSSFISSVSLGRRGVSSPGLTGSPSVADQTAPAGAVTARIYIEHNWKTGDASGTTYFSDFKVTTGAQTMLTSSGLSSFNNGVQTLRLNGEDNLMIGEVMTGRPGVEPYIKISSRTTVAALDFYGIPDTNQTNHGGIWWQVDVGGTGVGRLRLYAMDDPPVISGNRQYAAGMDMYSDGVIEFQGRLGLESETIQSNTMSFPTGFGPNGTTQSPAHYGTYNISFNSPYPTGVIPNVIVSMTASAGSEVVATVKSVTRTGFEVLIVNFGPRNSGTGTKLNWVAIRI